MRFSILFLTIALHLLAGQQALANCQGSSPLSSEKANAQNPDCDKNHSADHDVNRGANMFSGSHTCFDIYKTIVEKIDAYDNKRSASCQEIQNLVTKAKSCKTDDCFQESKNAYLQAAKKERELADFLAQTRGEIEKLGEKAEKVLEKYRDDNRKMIDATNRAKQKKAQIEQQLQASTTPSDLGKELATVNDLIKNARGVRGTELVPAPVPGESGISSRDGGGNSIEEYRQNIPELVEEQATAKIRAQTAAQKAAQQEQYHKQQAAMYEKLAAQSGTRKDNTKTAGENTDQNGGKKTPEDANNSQISDDPQKEEAAGAPSGGGGSPSGGGSPAGESPAGGSDPFQSSVGESSGETAVANKAPSIQSKKNKMPKPFDLSNARSKTEGLEAARAQLKSQMAGSGESSTARRGRELASETGSGANGNNGVSASSTGGAGGGGSATEKSEGDKKKDEPRFGQNLDAGFVDIAGSEIAQSVNSMAEELGLTKSDGLTPEEEAQLAASEIEEAADPSLLSEESQALFIRTKLAIQRAESRGDLAGPLAKSKFPFF